MNKRSKTSKRCIREKLKRRGNDIYEKYFFNSDDVLIYIIECIDLNREIDYNKCDVIFLSDKEYDEKKRELIRYIPNKLKEIKIIDNNVINNLYDLYGETISLMKKFKGINIRSKITNSAKSRVSENNIEFNIISEDIILPEFCPYFGKPLKYGLNLQDNFSPSLDRIDPDKGYVKDNIQVISFLANRMKNNASRDELLLFAKGVIKLYENF